MFRKLFGGGEQPNNRKFERYQVDAPLTATLNGEEFACTVDNVSAGGVKISPPVQGENGDTVLLTHTKTGLKLEGQIMGVDPDGTRIKFQSEEAGTIVSIWVRTLHAED